jgi:O-antigen/teichoic acid export membrane protein
LLTRVILTQADSLAAVGLFGLATRIASPLTGLLVPAFNMAYLPLYFSIRKEATEAGLTQLAAMSRHVWLAALACFLGVALLGPPAILLVTPEHYHPAIPLVPVLCAGFLAQTMYTLLGPEIFYAKRTWLVPVVSAAGMVVTLAMSAALAPAYGALGIAWATTFGSIAATIPAVYFSLQTVTIPHDWYGLARAACVAILLFFCGYLTAGETAWRQVATGTAASAAFPVLLWLVGDQAIRESFHFARSVISRNPGPTA